ncbi:MAG TPA: hypothetical protein VMW01_01995 [Williamwhitmania sp.]|nr:hypothetical protein [Williamwhitmania sp.]
MSKLSVFLPHAVWFMVVALYILTILVWMIIAGVIVVRIFVWKKGANSVWPNYVWRMSAQTWERILYGFISGIALLFITFFLVPWFFGGYLHGKPSADWRTRARQANTAIIFGFGYGTDGEGNMTPSVANQTLLDSALAQTNATYLIMQEGVYVAAEEAKQHGTLGNRQLIRIHLHTVGKDVNTLQAAKFAVLQMEKLGVKQAVVYAHDLQLARAVFDLQRVAASNPKWHDMKFIFPKISKTPSPSDSNQLRTRWRVVYRAIELYYSRVRDAWSSF